MRRLAVSVGFVAALFAAREAQASFHIMKVVEVFGGTTAAPAANYVVLQMYSAGQNLVNTHEVTIFDHTGALTATLTFAANVANGANQSKILVGTTEVAALFGVVPDLTAAFALDRAGGKACFDAIPVDCVEWGSLVATGVHPWTSAASPGLPTNRALARKLGSNGTLEGADDTDNSLNDFAPAVPAPTSNGGAIGVAPAGTCGDNTVTGLEQCDDGNAVGGDGCTATCELEVCGDGIDNNLATEACDDGNLVDGDGCDTNCTVTACGNGIVTSGETCDDGNLVDGDGCDHLCCPAGGCVTSSCGDGVLDPGEECDDHNTVDTDECSNACVIAKCGDGIVQPGAGEQCDDSNAVDGDGCSTTCKAELCGDGVIQATEECDDANTTADDGCTATCKLEKCGDGVVQIAEDCDDGNTSNTDGCLATCVKASCGDGFVGPGEECDGGDECNTDCTLPGGDDGGCCGTSSRSADTTAALAILGVAFLLRRRRT